MKKIRNIMVSLESKPLRREGEREGRRIVRKKSLEGERKERLWGKKRKKENGEGRRRESGGREEEGRKAVRRRRRGRSFAVLQRNMKSSCRTNVINDGREASPPRPLKGRRGGEEKGFKRSTGDPDRLPDPRQTD